MYKSFFAKERLKTTVFLFIWISIHQQPRETNESQEYLGIYLCSSKRMRWTWVNTDMLNKAEAIRCIRTQSLINEEFGFWTKHDRADFLAGLRRWHMERWQVDMCSQAFPFKFVQGHCTFGDAVDSGTLQKFREHRSECKLSWIEQNKRCLSTPAAGYYSTFPWSLKIAYRDKWRVRTSMTIWTRLSHKM